MAKTSFDLGSLDTIEACNKPYEFEIRHPVSGAGTGVFWSVVGRDSDVYRSRTRAMADETLRKQAMGGKGSAETLDKLEQKNIDAMVAATTGYRTGDDPTVMLKGEKLDFSPVNARKVLSEILPIRDQVLEALNDLANFMRA
jgi:hypothetical protein